MRLGVADDTQAALPDVAPPPSPARAGGVRVKGVGDLLVRFAQLLPPDPGRPDPGLHHPGQGRHGPPAAPAPRCSTSARSSRLIDVEWEAAPQQTYPIAIRVEAYDRTGLLSDITQVVAEAKVNILAADVAGRAGPHRGRARHAPGGVGEPARPRPRAASSSSRTSSRSSATSASAPPPG